MLRRSISILTLAAAALTAQTPATTLTATPGNGTVTLNWTPPGTLTNLVYRVYRGTAPNVALTNPIHQAPNLTSYVDTAVSNGSTYYYRVQGVRPIGAPSNSNEVFATPAGPPTPPPAPQNFTATAGTSQIALNWTGVPGATSYSVFRGTTPNGQGATPYAAGLTSFSFLDNLVTPGTTYYYRVAAVNAVGTGAFSVEAAATPNAPAQPPQMAPVNPSAVAGNAVVTINWGAIPGALSYNLYRGTSANFAATTPFATNIRVVTFTDRAVQNGITYFYRISAVNAAGIGPSSREVNATPAAPLQPPGPPTGLTLVTGNGQITLSWTSPLNGVVSSYNIYRSTSPIFNAGTPTVSGVTNTTYVDTGLTNNTTYFYRIAAVNAAGPGALSPEASAAPNAPAPPPPSGTPTLFFAQLSPEGAAQTGASGSATIQFSGDERTAILRYSFSNLTTPITGKHLHGPALPTENGAIAFDIDTAVPQPDGSFVWTITDIASASRQQLVDALRSGRIYLNIHTVRFPGGEIRGHFRDVTAGTNFTPPPPPPALPPGPPSANDAARFLTQATWGPTLAEITRVQQLGYDGWLNEQFTAPQRSHLAYVRAHQAANNNMTYRNQVMETLWTQALTGPDQLRARVALALSEILVVSDADDELGNDPAGMASWFDMLNRDAFGNFRGLLEDVTLHTTMGRYLNMMRNEKENPTTGRVPNENFAREILQLFSMGLWQLNPDGSLKFDAQLQPIPTYDQDDILQFSRVFTGWSWGNNPKTNSGWYSPANRDTTIPMEAWPQFHSTGPKPLLNGFTVPTGQTPEQDLRQALDNIFNHPNVGPFICRQLIQRLVTSNPSPGYIYRVAQVFANNGSGVRGDLRAVVRAILLDYEARSSNMLSNQGYGKQKEPMIRFGQLLRAFRPTSVNGTFSIWNLEGANSMGQNPLRAPTVFNFFLPHYVQPGPLASAGLVAPEFQITTESQVIAAMNTLSGIIYSGGFGSTDRRISIDLSPHTAIAANTNALLDQLNLLLLAGQMSPGLRSAVADSLTGLTDPLQRTRRAIHMIIVSPEWVTQK